MPFNLRNTLVTPRDSSHQPVTEALKYCRGVLRIRMRRFLEHPYRKESEDSVPAKWWKETKKWV